MERIIIPKLISDCRLVTYGTLSPGEVNHHELAALKGVWRRGRIRGILVKQGWGADLGFPGLKLDPFADLIDVFVLEPEDLPGHWKRLDRFEGEEYRRVVTTVQTEALDASIYVIRE